MLEIKEASFTLEDVEKVVFNNTPIQVSDALIQKVAATYTFLEAFSKDKIIYGINTGLGPMAQYRVNEEDAKQLQLNLIRSHCAGTGKPLDTLQTKACMLARMNSFLQAKSGVHPSAITLLQALINHNVSPVIYEHGGVGASGDLVQLAHLAHFLIGEGEGLYQGKLMLAKDIMAQIGVEPLGIHVREGLAIMNGTSAMTGVGLVNIVNAKRLFNWAIATSALINELVESYDDHFSEELNNSKRHVGQSKVAKAIGSFVKDSQLIKKRKEHLYVSRQDEVFKEKVQEYYSIRCTPQILGPVYDTILYAEEVLLNELNSANDNPVIDVEAKNVFHGGNFHGDYVALEMDKLKIAITKLTMLIERQINYLFNHKLNEKFPPFLNMGTLGLNLGLQGMQFTATSTTAENQTLSYPMYLHSIPNNGDNQDIVSMGCNAALITAKVLENAYQVMGIQMMVLAQAFAIFDQDQMVSSQGLEVLQQIRKHYQPSKTDRTLSQSIKSVTEWVQKGQIDFLHLKWSSLNTHVEC
jgi:histidine ammonia-lyase